MIELERHPLSALFPSIPDDELQLLAADIRQNGQREPVLTYEGKVLDGWNRVRACRLISKKPWVMEFDPASAKMTPIQLVISANLRRRHLSVGQLSAIAVEFSEQIELEGGNTRDALTANSAHTGRPKAVLTAAAEMIGIDERRGREAGAVKTASAEVFTQLKIGAITLNEAMEKIRPPTEAEPPQPVSQDEAIDQAALDIEAAEPAGVPVFGATEHPFAPIANKPVAQRLNRRERIEQAWQDVGRIFRFGQKSLDAFRASQRLSDAEALEFESLESDADKLRVRQAIQNNQLFSEAVKPFAGVDPKEPIQKLHTKTVRNDGFFSGQVGEFYHVVVHGERAASEARLKGWPAN